MTDTTTPVELGADERELWAALATAQAHLADAEAKVAELKSLLKQRITALGDYTIDGRPVLRMAPNRRFDVNRAIEYVPEDRRQECLSVQLDAAKVKQLLTPEQADLCMVAVGQPKVVAL